MLLTFSKFYKDLGISKITAYAWVKEGRFELVQSDSGRNFVTKETYDKFINLKQAREVNVIYAHVPSLKQVRNLDSQVERLVKYCDIKGWHVHKIVKDAGSSLCDKRPKLDDLLFSERYTRLIIEDKDRLTKFGFNFLDDCHKAVGKEIHILRPSDEFKNTIEEFASRYGLRRVKL